MCFLERFDRFRGDIIGSPVEVRWVSLKFLMAFLEIFDGFR